MQKPRGMIPSLYSHERSHASFCFVLNVLTLVFSEVQPRCIGPLLQVTWKFADFS
jgi:hypothetical protein